VLFLLTSEREKQREANALKEREHLRQMQLQSRRDFDADSDDNDLSDSSNDAPPVSFAQSHLTPASTAYPTTNANYNRQRRASRRASDNVTDSDDDPDDDDDDDDDMPIVSNLASRTAVLSQQQPDPPVPTLSGMQIMRASATGCICYRI